MSNIDKLIENNQEWSAGKISEDKDFFNRLKDIQHPDFLWIGCSDSRVPADQITGTQPGEIFVHRNIANMVVHTDLNLLSVLEYAVVHLKVKEVIVCGHYGCGGVKAAMGRHDYGLINKWLRNIKDVYRYNKNYLDAIRDENARANKLVELNVIEQVYNVCETTIIQRAWKNDNAPNVHGWVYGLDDGKLHKLIQINAGTPNRDLIYDYDNL
jgi:carbonic anhydrase